jgi:uncharacterized protein (DUF111 family)
VERSILERKEYTVKTTYGVIGIKEAIFPDGNRRYKPEYKDMKEISLAQNIPVSVIREEVDRIFRNNTNSLTGEKDD